MKTTFLATLSGLLTITHLALAQAPATTNQPGSCAVANGYVTDGTQPLAGVSVMVQGTKQLVVTNGAGYFALPLGQVSPAKLFFDAVGYETRALTVSSCQPVRVELSLLPGTRVRQHGKRKGFVTKAGELPTASAN